MELCAPRVSESAADGAGHLLLPLLQRLADVKMKKSPRKVQTSANM